ncbi:aldo/keto reductase [Gemmatimonas phototrophica]|uniref:Aldo/keto reductase n=1 Tax=Gemmatimonas phototrophica TaxID=1379270 RepID=A0A143BNJ0_9BACT|nr:aldo/keto reductase [Gemmatimonas phototrophica]AMW06082.1 aldo/keto reductase [Gemmatimonas phototrophica]
MMQRTTLAPGLEISRVLTGLWQIADMERDGRVLDLDAAAQAMAPYVEAGLTTFDMADHYGSAELVAGKFRRASSAAVQCLTKWVPEPGPVSAEDTRTAVERACSRLQTDTIDLLQFHAWTFADPRWLDALWHLEAERDAGRITAIGVTNFDTAHLRVAIASGIRLVSNQVSGSLVDTRFTRTLAPYAREHGVGVLCYGTVLGGFLSEKWLGAPEPNWETLDTWSQMKYGRFIRTAGGWGVFQQLLQVVHAVAQKHGVSIATVASRWVLDQPGVAGVIVGARLSHSQHVGDTARIFAFAMDDADRSAIAAAQAALLPIPGDCGDEYRTPPYLTASGDLSHHLSSFPAPFSTRPGHDGRTLALSGTVWEPMAGYSRAVRKGQRIHVSGTTATHGSRAIGGTDAAAQTHFCIDKIAGALQSLGGRLEDVVRSRVFVSNVNRDWEAVARAHGERFGHILPANTMVEAHLIGDEYLVEIEVDADLGPA